MQVYYFFYTMKYENLRYVGLCPINCAVDHDWNLVYILDE